MLPRLFVLAALCIAAGFVHAGITGTDMAASLRARYDGLQDLLRLNQFRRPLHIDSSATGDRVTGDVHALVDYPFATTGAALDRPEQWCDILILHFNIKWCRASTIGSQSVLNVDIGRKYDQPHGKAYRVVFVYDVAAHTADYLNLRLEAENGPLSTRNYRIMLEAGPVADGRTFIHLAYSYDSGVLGRMAMQTYLGTIGRDKVGFTVVGRQSDGRPLYISGMRGVVERNAMRYYLAVEAYLGALSVPPQAQLDKRLSDWFAASESYLLQLHEMERGEYLDMKRKEVRRQQAAAAGSTDMALRD